MAAPNDSGPPKKPQAAPGAKPPAGQQPAPRTAAAPGTPAAGGKPAARPAQGQQPARPGAPAGKPAAGGPPAGAKPAPGKPADGPAGKAPPGKAPADKAAAAKAPADKGDGKKPDKKASAKRDPVALRGKAKTVGGRRLGQVLVDLGFMDDEQLWELLDEAKNTGGQLGQVALGRGLITEEQLLQALADQFGLKVVNLQEVKPQPEALQLVPETMASVYKVLPMSFKDNVLTVVVGDPANLSALDDLRNLLSIQEVQAGLAPPAAVAEILAKCYAGKEETIMDIISQLESDGGEAVSRRGETSIDLDSLMEIQNEAPVRKLLNMVMLLAIKDRASDIHFEPFEDEYKIRMRADGVLYEMVPPPRHLAPAIASRIKVMSNLDIAERRLPQDGRIELNVGGNPVDMRVSVLPTMFGESVVIRVLDRTNVGLDLNKIGMGGEDLVAFRQLIHKPNGIILITGPTGSGKTTTLYSALSELNEITDKIITTEDPVEYDIDGIVQVQINTDVGLTFASALRSILRQDPDKILVGEIRDLETAQIAVQASLTGHTVFSTLHTNDAPSTVTRLRDMGLETYLITATLEGIQAQRLVRKICEDCRTEFEPSDDMLLELSLRRGDVAGKKFYYGKGCDRCNNTGFRGRSGLFELVVVNDELRDVISSGASTDQLREACRRQGMVTLREAGLKAIFNGVTTIEEVVRETILEEDM
jgi:type IV pilus assembly protein PilB